MGAGIFDFSSEKAAKISGNVGTRGVLALWKCIHISYRGAKNAFRKLVFVRQSRTFRDKRLVFGRYNIEQIPV